MMDPNEVLDEAIGEGDLQRAREALSRGADPNKPVGVFERSPLIWAVHCGQADIVRLLLSSGSTVESEKKPQKDQTSLHVAVATGDLDMIRLLLEADGHVALNTFDYVYRTPLMCAVESGHLEAARMLLQAGSDVNAHDEEHIGDTAVKLAVEKKDLAMVDLLLNAGADPTILGWMGISTLNRVINDKDEREGMGLKKRLEEFCALKGLNPKDYLYPSKRRSKGKR